MVLNRFWKWIMQLMNEWNETDIYSGAFNEALTNYVKLTYLLCIWEFNNYCALHTSKLRDTTSAYLFSASCLADAIPLETVSISATSNKKKRFLLGLSLAPGYSKLQIAADNIVRYWNMSDFLTHTADPPPSFSSTSSSLLLLQNSGKAWSINSD